MRTEGSVGWISGCRCESNPVTVSYTHLVTLPLVSYGGSSILSTFILFGVIQGLYVLKRNEEEEEEQQLDEAEG